MGIRSLARDLDLSIGTVSRALNDRPDVSCETRARVKAAAVRAGYMPNQSGRSLRKGRTGIVAAVIPTSGLAPSTEATFLKVLEGVRRTLLRNQLDLIVLFRGPDEDPLDHLHRIVSRRIADGIIITELAPGDARIPFLEAAGVDFVAFGRSGDSDHAWVDFDFESVARVTARQFTTTGHHRLAVVLNDLPLNHNRILESGFRAEARRAGLPDAAVEIWRTRNGALDQAQRARLAAPDAPTGFLAGNDTIAASLYAGLAAAGHAVGRDAAVVSAFPVLSLQGLSPPLSCFVADLDAVGVALARQLGARLRESPAERRDLPPDRIPLRFDPRGSETCHRCQTERRQSLTHAPLRPDERTQASTKATPASPSAMSG